MQIIIEKDQVADDPQRLPNQPNFYYVKMSENNHIQYQNDSRSQLFFMALLEEKLRQNFASVVVDKYPGFYYRFTLSDPADAAFLEMLFDHSASVLQYVVEI